MNPRKYLRKGRDFFRAAGERFLSFCLYRPLGILCAKTEGLIRPIRLKIRSLQRRSEGATRVCTALTLALFPLLGIIYGGMVLRMALLAIACLSLHEFLDMHGVRSGGKITGQIFCVLIIFSQALGPVATLLVLALVLPVAGTTFLLNYARGNRVAGLADQAPLFAALLYIPLILQLGLYLTQAEQFLVVLAAVASDTGGYYAGTRFGKHRLCPSVSPRKSWEGFFGGLFLCLLVCALMGFASGSLEWRFLRLPLWAWFCIGAALHLAAVCGDLFESALKRSLQRKDSGVILPGHGGMLDRVDSILFVMAAFMFIRLGVRMLQGA
ncbi:MAG: phosphatidate cytidylyltransferase [Desulfovibrio sp.]|jgi:phosphatidate cytidylyltransferase|nr:phosphatidate cytidylyltransferase [Desulfovibrio sp.]